MIKDAIISECLSYRYTLSRKWNSENPKTLLFCMLNPSTADANLDDPTIRRCIGFAKSWGYDEIIVINLYALRTPSPKDLWPHSDPIGLENNQYLKELANKYLDIVCAWGGNAKKERVQEVAKLFKGVGANLYCLGTTKDGSPKHPLYIKGDKQLEPWGFDRII